jgi:small subunit ribosomal protein S17
MTETLSKKRIVREKTGVVVSDKMDKTVVVAVATLKTHQKYKKRFTYTTKFQAHDEKNEYKVGDTVRIQEARPMSRHKRWRVVGKVETTK